MKMKSLFPIMMFAAAPMVGVAQNNSGLVEKNFDKSVRPQDDFYQFATGGWQKNNPLPAAYSRFGSFDQLQEDNNKRINSILSDLQKKKFKKGSIEQKLSDFYKQSLNVDVRNKAGIAPVKSMLDEIESAKTVNDLRAMQIKYAEQGYGIQFGSYFSADEKDVKNNILSISQSGLTLGQKDYYVNNDSATVAIREAYKKHIARLFKLYGFDEAAAQAKSADIFRQETLVALISKSMTELRDPQANYNKMTLAEFKSDYPNIPLEQLANSEGVKSEYIQSMVVGQPAFMTGLDKLMSLQTADEIKALMEWDVIQNSASYLSDEIREANFDFFGKTMSGRKEDYPLWKRATSQVEAQLGEPLGRMYCKRYFPESSKKIMLELVKNLQVSLGQRIDAQTWMSDTTKAAAHEKLNKFYVKIGYPNKWTDYSSLQIDPSKSFYENVMACRKFAHDKHINDKAGKPVDRDEWYMTPQTVNAFYSPETNSINFPAAILQAPFFDPEADAAANFGGIGSVIGHEMSHGFDDQGCQFDKNGNLNNWWTAEDKSNYDKRTKVLADWFSTQEVLPGLKVNGEKTLGENIGDNGGINVAFRAFENAIKKNPLESKDGFTPEQRFFLAYGRIWASNIAPQFVAYIVNSDTHSPNIARVNGALPMIDAWYDTFGIKQGDKLYVPIEKRAHIW